MTLDTTENEIIKAICNGEECTIDDIVLHLQKEMVNKADLEDLLAELEKIKEQQKVGTKAIEDLRVAEQAIKEIKERLDEGGIIFEEIKEMISSVRSEARECVREPDFIKVENFQKEILSEVQTIRKQQDEDRIKIEHEEEQGVIRNGKADTLTKNISDMREDIAFLRGRAEGQTESKSNSWKQWQLIIAALGMIIAFVTVLLSVTGVI